MFLGTGFPWVDYTYSLVLKSRYWGVLPAMGSHAQLECLPVSALPRRSYIHVCPPHAVFTNVCCLNCVLIPSIFQSLFIRLR